MPCSRTSVSEVLTAVRSGQFRRDVRRLEKRGKDLAKLRAIVLMLLQRSVLPAACKDHPLRGEWKSYRDAHIEPDWLLIYRIADDELQLVRTGTHADLFDE